MKLNKFIKSMVIASSALALTTSCSDMMDYGNDYVMYTGKELCNPNDTVTSLIGIINKLQALGVRTNLLGEVRADLVDVRNNATLDLKRLAANDADVMSDDDANIYNNPRDYYAVINNCNYFLKYASETAGNDKRNEVYFKREIAQVHSIRAWVYLQLVLVYGQVPYYTEPILTKQDAEKYEKEPQIGIAEVCDRLIEDLTPYVGEELPKFTSVGGAINPFFMYLPSQIVLGDLYLWKAAATQDPMAARQAAKSYYDYIVFDKNGKEKLATGTSRYEWNLNEYPVKSTLGSPRSAGSSSSQWGRATSTNITILPMDSASSVGYYNDLKSLYNTQYEGQFIEASITPSQQMKDLSSSQVYCTLNNNDEVVTLADRLFDENGNLISITPTTNYTDELVENGYVGDLRYARNFSSRQTNYNSTLVDVQYISKHSSQHITLYRTSQVYLRLAEALNYAGYPRFAKAILTLGLSDMVIDNEVKPYYPSDADQAFISYFKFENNSFRSLAERYETVKHHGIIVKASPIQRLDLSACNTWGIHNFGSGLSYVDTYYCPALVADSTEYPYISDEAVGKQPQKTDPEFNFPTPIPPVRKPSTWDSHPGVRVTQEEYYAINSQYDKSSLKQAWNMYSAYYGGKDSVQIYIDYLANVEEYNKKYAESMALYEAAVDAYNERLNLFLSDRKTWAISAFGALVPTEQKTVDEAILTEQALELAYEGNRFFDLMRRAMWYNKPEILSDAVSKRDAAAGNRLKDKKNWYLKWKGLVGF